MSFLISFWMGARHHLMVCCCSTHLHLLHCRNPLTPLCIQADQSADGVLGVYLRVLQSGPPVHMGTHFSDHIYNV